MASRPLTKMEENQEELLLLSVLADKIKTHSYYTLHRMCRHGEYGIKLECIQNGKWRYSSIPAYWRYMRAINDARESKRQQTAAKKKSKPRRARAKK